MWSKTHFLACSFAHTQFCWDLSIDCSICPTFLSHFRFLPLLGCNFLGNTTKLYLWLRLAQRPIKMPSISQTFSNQIQDSAPCLFKLFYRLFDFMISLKIYRFSHNQNDNVVKHETQRRFWTIDILLFLSQSRHDFFIMQDF